MAETNFAKGLTVLGTVLDIGSQIYGGFLQSSLYKSNAMLARAQGEYTSAVAEYNAAVARAQQQAIRSVADLDIARQQKAKERFTGKQAAGYAKAGVKYEGSPLLVMIDSAAEANLDIAITDYNAKMGILQAGSKEQQYKTESEIAKSTSKAESSMLKAAGRFERGQAFGKSASTLLSTVSRFA